MSRILRTVRLLLLAGGLCILPSESAWAQTDAAKVSAAREVSFQGVKDYQAGRYAEASKKLEKGYALLKGPVIGLWSARALVKVGRYVLAAERYLETTRAALPTSNREKHKQAQADAATERAALMPKIPGLTIKVVGAPSEEVQATMDGAPMDSGLLGIRQPVDPGGHSIEARYKGQVQKVRVKLEESKSRTVELKFDPNATAAAAPGPTTPPAGSPKTDPGSPRADAGGSSGPPTLAYIALGVGGVGLAAGAVTGVLAMGKKSDLDDSGHCRDGVCDATVHSDLQSLNTMRTISTVGFAVGAVGVGAGLVMIFTAGDTQPAAKRSNTPRVSVGLGSVAVGGHF